MALLPLGSRPWYQRALVAWKTLDAGTRALAAVTSFAAAASIALIGGAGWFRPNGHWPGLEELDHVGSWLGGVFAPIALAWTARAFFLQRDQMRAEEARRNEERLDERVRWHAEMVSTAPAYTVAGNYLEYANGDVRQATFTVINHGAAAVNARIEVWIGDREQEHFDGESANCAFYELVHHDQAIPEGHSFEVKVGLQAHLVKNVYEYTVIKIISERRDGNLAICEFEHEYEFGFRFRRRNSIPVHFDEEPGDYNADDS